MCPADSPVDTVDRTVDMVSPMLGEPTESEPDEFSTLPDRASQPGFGDRRYT